MILDQSSWTPPVSVWVRFSVAAIAVDIAPFARFKLQQRRDLAA